MNTELPYFIILDGEFGGIGDEYSMLTMYFEIADKNFNKIDDLYLYLKPNDGIYHVNGEALSVNRINISLHDVMAKTYKEGGTLLYNFLKKNSDDGKIKLIPVGHGMSGDLNQIYDKLISQNTWNNFVSYRRIDTSVACQFLKLCNILPDEISGSLENLAKYFNVHRDNAHDAMVDVFMIKDVLQKLVEKMKSLQPNSSFVIDCG